MLRQNRVEEAAEIAATMARERPHDAQARFAMALVDRQRGATDRALASLERLAGELPQNPLITLEFAGTLVTQGQADRALPILQAILAQSPTLPLAHFWLGQAHLRSFRGVEAAESFERMRELAPRNLGVLEPLATAYLDSGRPALAERILRELLAAQPDNQSAAITLVAAVEQQGRLAENRPLLDRLLERSPGEPQALAALARLLQNEGRRDEARELLRPALAVESPHPVVVSTFAPLCATPEDRALCLAKAREAIDAPHHVAQHRAGLYFAAAQLLEAGGDPQGAFAMHTRRHELTPRLTNPEEDRHRVDQLIETFSAQAIRTMPRASEPSSRPIFILGMPRSGTTLVEQILAAHPRVFAAGEQAELRRLWRDLVAGRGQGRITGLARLTQADVNAAAGRYLAFLNTLDDKSPRVTDKMPHNFEQLGLINLLFPDARVLHCVRSPLDTCLSCYTTRLGLAHTYAADLTTLGQAYAQYHRLMAHWRETLDIPMLEVVYEDLVADLDTHARRIVGFVGLPWHDACLRFYEAERSVTTASVDQVRKPIYTTSIGRWRHYADLLDPLRRALAAGGVPMHDADA